MGARDGDEPANEGSHAHTACAPTVVGDSCEGAHHPRLRGDAASARSAPTHASEGATGGSQGRGGNVRSARALYRQGPRVSARRRITVLQLSVAEPGQRRRLAQVGEAQRIPGHEASLVRRTLTGRQRAHATRQLLVRRQAGTGLPLSLRGERRGSTRCRSRTPRGQARLTACRQPTSAPSAGPTGRPAAPGRPR